MRVQEGFREGLKGRGHWGGGGAPAKECGRPKERASGGGSHQERARALAPVAASSSAMEPMTTSSSPSSDAQMGMGVPQKRERETAQSCALSSQLWKRFSFT